MWVLNNDTPFAADRTLIADKDGRDSWIVAVKGTFDIHPDGTTDVSEEQEDVVLAPKHYDDPVTSSLKYECDLDYTKPGTDVVLHGHAYAPAGKPATRVNVGMKIGNISKVLRVHGDRYWGPGVGGFSKSGPQPFTKMALGYERAYGGIDAEDDRHWDIRNPVGAGYAKHKESLDGQRAPNVEDPRKPIRVWNDRPPPAGFGPIARHWMPRRQFAGTYDKQWEDDRQPLLPQDFDERFFLCAPGDQQVLGGLKGSVPVEMRNLSPGGELRFDLPRVAIGLSTRIGSERVEHRPSLHTVILEPDVPRVILVWHSMLHCHGRKLQITGTDIVRKAFV